MNKLEVSSIFSGLQYLLSLVAGALRLDSNVFREAYQMPPDGFRPVLWIVMIAGLSLMLGQSVVLFANQIPPKRFALSILWGALKFMLDVLVVVTVIWGFANIIGTRPWNYAQVARGLALSAAPYWFGFLILIPYIGMIVDRLLKVYVFLALVTAIQAVFGINFWNAVWGGAITFVLQQLISVVFGRLFTPLTNQLDRMIRGGQDQQIRNARQIYEYFTQRDLINSSERFTDGLDN